MKKFCLILMLFAHSLWGIAQKEDIELMHEKAYAFLDSNLDSALFIASKSQKLAHSERLPLHEAKSLFISAYVYRAKDEVGKSFIQYLEALELLEPENKDEHLSLYLKLLLNTGEILESHSAFDLSIQYYDEGIQLAFSNKKFRKSLMRLYFNKSIAEQLNKGITKAIESIDLALQIAIERDDEARILSYLNRKGLILIDNQEYSAAESIFKQLLNYPFVNTSPEKIFAQSLHNLGHLAVLTNEPEQATNYYERALKWRKKVNDVKGEFETLVDLTETHLMQKNWQSAIDVGEKALSLYPKQAVTPSHYQIYHLISQVSYAMGDYDRYNELAQIYYDENEKFLEMQSELIKKKDIYKMEVLTAGFFAQQSNDNDWSMYNYMLLLALVISYAIYAYIKKVKTRVGIVNDLRKIDQESNI